MRLLLRPPKKIPRSPRMKRKPLLGASLGKVLHIMKKHLKLLCLTALLLAVISCITACGKWGDTYAKLDDEGYTVSVRFDANGGVFAGTNDVSVVDVFNLDDMKTDGNGQKYTYLLTPDDALRGQSAYSVSNNGHFLAGWYAERTPRVNENGEPLDEYGVPTAQSGREQGYVYSKPWNFDEPMTLDPNGEYTAGENYLTLYAAWIPYFRFEFYAKNPATGEVSFHTTVEAISMDMPAWNEKTGKLDMKKFPSMDGMTFDGAFLDEAMTETAPATITGVWDPATGVSTTETIKLYTTWLEGDWYRIYTAKQFYDNSRLGGNYILCADLDFEGAVWAPALTKGKFTGSIVGNGHTISNITVEQADNTQLQGGLFGALDATVKMTDVTFENITYKIGAGSRMQGASFGLLAGSVADGAVFENVSLSGTLIVGANCIPSDYLVGLICGTGTASAIDHSRITVSVEEVENTTTTITAEVDAESGRVTLTFGE